MFQEFLGTLGLAEFNLNTDLYKIGLVTSTLTPVTGAADPGWAAGRTTNYLANEVTPGGNYSTGGADITNTYAEAAGVGKFDAADQAPYVAVDASNATNARWGILYNDTDVDKKAIGFLDLGADFDMTTGDLNITWNGSGIFTFTLS
jgi:hypothetical protein